jgi:hypothetical protein
LLTRFNAFKPAIVAVLVREDRCLPRHVISDGRSSRIAVFVSDDPRERLPPQSALADRKGAQTLHVLVFFEATINAILDLVFKTDVAASVLAVNLDLGIDHHPLPAPCDGLEQLHQEDLGGLVLDADFARELERDALPFTELAENHMATSIFLKLSLRACKTVPEVTLNNALQVFSVHLKRLRLIV